MKMFIFLFGISISSSSFSITEKDCRAMNLDTQKAKVNWLISQEKILTIGELAFAENKFNYTNEDPEAYKVIATYQTTWTFSQKDFDHFLQKYPDQTAEEREELLNQGMSYGNLVSPLALVFNKDDQKCIFMPLIDDYDNQGQYYLTESFEITDILMNRGTGERILKLFDFSYGDMEYVINFRL
jgi:hypothetical protein